MSEKEMPAYYWAEAIHAIVYIMNTTPTTAIHNITPKEKFIGKKNLMLGTFKYMNV